MNVISLFHSLLYKDNNCINMEKYPFYYIASVPLCLPSFFVVFRVIKNKFLKSVFNQQITLMLLLNGNNLKGWVFDIFLGKSLNSSSRLILPTDPKGPHFVSGLSPRLSTILKQKKNPNMVIIRSLRCPHLLPQPLHSVGVGRDEPALHDSYQPQDQLPRFHHGVRYCGRYVQVSIPYLVIFHTFTKIKSFLLNGLNSKRAIFFYQIYGLGAPLIMLGKSLD